MATRNLSFPGKTVCPCPHPPGGSMVCDEGQLAICRIKNGQIEAVCLTAPKSLMDQATKFRNPMPFAEWAIQSALGPDLRYFVAYGKDYREHPVESAGSFLRRNLETFLNNEWRFENPRTREQVMLTMPLKIQKDDPSGAPVEMPESLNM